MDDPTTLGDRNADRLRHADVFGASYAVRGGLVGESREGKVLLDRVARIAPSHVPVLLRGEVGCEFEAVARAVHLNSRRAHGPFVGEACAVLRDPTLIRQLFGHVRGAFTGAGSTSDGVLAIADGGTLYLHEIADLLPEAQGCLVRVLESGEYRPLGAANARHTDLRIISSTAADVSALVRSGHFRGDLYYRLRGAIIDIPPLRRRREDIARFALDELKAARKLASDGAIEPSLPRDVEAALMAHDWPGNTRELRQEIQQAIALCSPGPLQPDMLLFRRDPPPVAPRRPLSARPGLRSRIGEFEAQAVREALGEAGGNKAEAARRLGITRRTLYRRLAQMRGESES